MPKLVTREGQEVQLAPDEAAQAFRTGAAGFAGPLAVVGSDGQMLTIDASEAQAALEGGYRLASDVEIEKQRLIEKHGGLEGAAKAGAEGLARGLSFGLSDLALTQTGLVAPEDLRGRQEANPGIALGAELTGAIAPLLASGGTSAAVSATRAVGLVPRATAAAGRAVETQAARLLGSRAGTLAGKGAQLAAGGAVEGAVMGAGQAISTASLDDHELTAEQLLAGAVDGALMGGATGGAIGVAGKAAQKAGQAVVRNMPEQLTKLTSREGIADLLDAYRDKQSFLAGKGTSGGKPFVKEALDKGGVEKIGRLGREEIGIAATDGVAEVAEKSAVARERLGKQIGDALERFDTAGTEAAPRAAKIADDIQQHVLAPLESVESDKLKRLGRQVRRELESQGLLDAERQWGFAELHKQRRVLDRLAYTETAQGAAGKLTPFGEQIAKARRVVEAEIEDAAGRASRELGDDVASTYRDVKERFQAVDLMHRMSTDATRRAASNDAVGLISGGFGNALAMADAIMSGGVGIDTLVIPFVAGKLHRMLRAHFPAITAAAAGKLRAAQKITQTAEKMEQATDRAVRGFFEGARQGAPLATVAVAGTRQERYDAALASLQERPEQVVERAVEQLRNVDDPKLSQAYAETVSRGRAFLESKAPKPRHDATALRPDLVKGPRVPDSEQSKFLRYVAAVRDPMSVVRALEKGDVTREGAEALRAVYPKTYERLTARVMDMVTRADKPLPRSKMRQLSLVLGVPLHFSMSPRFVAFAQAQYAPQQEQGPDQLLAPSSRKPPASAKQHATPTQAREMET